MLHFAAEGNVSPAVVGLLAMLGMSYLRRKGEGGLGFDYVWDIARLWSARVSSLAPLPSKSHREAQEWFTGSGLG